MGIQQFTMWKDVIFSLLVALGRVVSGDSRMRILAFHHHLFQVQTQSCHVSPLINTLSPVHGEPDQLINANSVLTCIDGRKFDRCQSQLMCLF